MTDPIFDHETLDVYRFALECAAIKNVLVVSGGIDAAIIAASKAKLKRIVAMLTRLVMRFDSVAEVPALQDGVVDYEHEHEHEHE